MLVILRENVQNLGRVGDVVNVTAGYARNFLLPRNLVIAADERNLKVVEHHKRSLEKKRQAQKANAEEIAKKLNAFTCTIKRKVGEGEKLYGSVTTADIATAMKAGGFSIEKRWVELDSPIKTLGVHTVTVKIDTDVEAKVKVTIAKEE